MSDNIFSLFDVVFLREQEEAPEEEVNPPEEEGGNIEGTEEDTGEMGEDPAAGMEEEKLDPVDLGNMYRLKKVYSRLLSVSDFLDFYTSEHYDELKMCIMDALDIFHTILVNYDSYKDKMPDIIKRYEQFVLSSVKELETISKNN